jgi:hypothetical protein
MGISIQFLQTSVKCFRSVLIYCVTLCILLTTLPLSLTILLPFFIYRQIVICVACLIHSEMGKVLSSRSIPAASEDLYTNPRMTIVLGIICEGTVNLEFIRQTIQKQAIDLCDEVGKLKYPELQQNVYNFMGYSFWRKTGKDFKVEEHCNYLNNSENSEMHECDLSRNLRKL